MPGAPSKLCRGGIEATCIGLGCNPPNPSTTLSHNVPPTPDHPSNHERRAQIRGLLYLALLAIAFSILRAGIHNVFTKGWWRLW